MAKVRIRAIPVVIFILIAVVIFVYLNNIFQPAWYDWNNYDTIHGFYEEPINTLETVFLGSSVAVNGIIPTQLYEDYGICAYNLATEQQPLLASYYWLKEVYRLHSKTLKTVVLDASSIRYKPDTALYRKAIDGMAFSPVKFEAVLAYAENTADAWEYLLPLTSYHSRWSSLTSSDFNKSDHKIRRYMRGYNFDKTILLNDKTRDLNDYVSDYRWVVDAGECEPDTEALQYFEKTVDFCKNNGLKLVLIQIPRIFPSSIANTIKKLAEKHGLDYLTFSYEPLISELDLNMATDSSDGNHLNYYGAKKLTAWLGKYLTENCGATDRRGDPQYAHLDDQLEEFKHNIQLSSLLVEKTDPVDYLNLVVQHPDLTIFIMAKDEASNAITEAQKIGFAEMGLHKLAALGYRDSYLAVIDKGTIILELSDHFDEASAGHSAFEPDTDHPLYLTYEGVLDNNESYTLKSGGMNLGNVASCIIEKTEYAADMRGLNIVVYDNTRHSVIDSAYFDTCVSKERISPKPDWALQSALEQNLPLNELPENLYQLYTYNLKVERSKDRLQWSAALDEDFLKYLDYYRTKPGIAIFISVHDEASIALDENAKNTLRSMGLTECSALGFRDSYVAIINEGKVLLEKRSQGTEPVYAEGINYSMCSGGFETGVVSSIMIDNQEFSPCQRGFNVVIYDKALNQVVDSAAFDTCANPVSSVDSIP